jgi:hypothetical protein
LNQKSYEALAVVLLLCFVGAAVNVFAVVVVIVVVDAAAEDEFG